MKVSQTARPGQAWRHSTLTRGRKGGPGGPVGSHFLSLHPSSHRHFCGLHCNPAGPASSGVWEGRASTSLLPPPDSLAAARLPWQPPSPLQRGQCSPCPSARPPRGLQLRMGLQRGVGPGEATPSVWERTALASQRTEAPCEEVVGPGNQVSPAAATWALYCLYV